MGLVIPVEALVALGKFPRSLVKVSTGERARQFLRNIPRIVVGRYIGARPQGGNRICRQAVFEVQRQYEMRATTE